MRVVCVALLLCAGPSFADVLTSTLGQPLREVSHTVDVAVDEGVAVYKVRRVFANAGSRADEAGLDIDLPYGAAATGLRIRARHRWYDGVLMEAQEAARLYQELTGFGAHAVKDPALLQWLWADKLHLQVFPVLPGSTSTVEYTLTVPTRYERGRVYVSYPHVATDAEGLLAHPVITIRPAWGDATTPVFIDGVRVAVETPVVLAPPTEAVWLQELGLGGAGAVASTVDVPELAATRGPFSKVTLALDLEHTYKGDLHIALITPSGARIEVFSGDGGGENDVRGTFPIALPQPEGGAGKWRLVVSDHAARDAGTLSAWSLTLGPIGKDAHVARAQDTPLFVPDAPESESDAGTASIAIGPPPIDVVTARLGKVVASGKSAFARLEIDTAPELQPLPKRARVVFVIDASHSAGTEHIEAQLALVRGQLAHVPDAAAELVVVRRHATRVFGRFVPALEVPTAIEALKEDAMAPGNGSALDEGVRMAVAALESALSAAPRGAPLRLVIFTDERMRGRFQNAWVLDDLRAAPARTIVHLVSPALDGGDESRLVRDDAAPLAPLAGAHHGIFARIDGLPASTKRVADVVLGLVRPVQIDAFAVRGFEQATHAAGDALHEGAGVRAMVALPRAPDQVVLTGKIWGDAYRKVVKVDGRFSRSTAAFVFGEDEHHALSPGEMMKVALMGRAVSPVTSYLATEPGVRPSTSGIVRDTFGVGGLGARGSGRGGGGAAYSMRRPPDLRALVEDGAQACIARHPAGDVTLEVETTRDEVVDVIAPAGRETEPLVSCIVDAVWAVRLTTAFDLERETFTLMF